MLLSTACARDCFDFIVLAPRAARLHKIPEVGKVFVLPRVAQSLSRERGCASGRLQEEAL